jgi:hypothetical protein
MVIQVEGADTKDALLGGAVLSCILKFIGGNGTGGTCRPDQKRRL